MSKVIGTAPRPEASGGFGERLRAARLRAGLTQTRLAGERYTKAFISALENDQSRPSVPALEYLAARLGLAPADLLGDARGPWRRLQADLRLAAGDWQVAADAYEQLLGSEVAPVRRAEALCGLAEAFSWLERPQEAVAAAAEAGHLFAVAGLTAAAARARYWQATGEYRLENPEEARTLLRRTLDEVRAGLRAEPDFELRVLIALARVDGREGHPERALSYLTEARGRVAELDDRRRAGFLESLAISYREAGDYEGAIILAGQALAYFRAAANESEVAILENELALTHLAIGDLTKARSHARSAHERLLAVDDTRTLARVVETEAAVALAQDDLEEAETHATAAAEFARSSGDTSALISALLTAGRIARRRRDPGRARAQFEEALHQARTRGRAPQVRSCLVELSDLAAAEGDTATAYTLAREALG